MLELLYHSNLIPFHLSLLLLIVLSVVETVGFYLKAPPSIWFKHFIPKKYQHAAVLKVKFSKLLIVVFLLLNFSVAGYFLQFAIYAQQQHFAPAYYLIFPTFIIALFFTVFMIHCLDQVLQPQYTPLSPDLLGRLATISTGNARPNFTAQARVRDQFGQLHYVSVEPEFGELELNCQIILIRKKNQHYIGKKISLSNHLFQSITE